VEDNEEMRQYIRQCLDDFGYQIEEAADGAEGIRKALARVPDLIISDVMMPEKDGFELTRSIRQHTATSHIPLILLTAKASLESRLKGLERGADAYLTKPFSARELALRVRKLIELRQLLRERYQSGSPSGSDPMYQQEDTFIAELNAFIRENISQTDLNVEMVSQQFGISRTQLYRKLEALAGRSVADHIRSIRMERAVQLLREHHLNVSEVAYQTGFSSPSAFSKTFKKFYGKTPSDIQ
jgi:DNA-binding response OmpR family regulator